MVQISPTYVSIKGVCRCIRRRVSYRPMHRNQYHVGLYHGSPALIWYCFELRKFNLFKHQVLLECRYQAVATSLEMGFLGLAYGSVLRGDNADQGATGGHTKTTAVRLATPPFVMLAAGIITTMKLPGLNITRLLSHRENGLVVTGRVCWSETWSNTRGEVRSSLYLV